MNNTPGQFTMWTITPRTDDQATPGIVATGEQSAFTDAVQAAAPGLFHPDDWYVTDTRTVHHLIENGDTGVFTADRMITGTHAARCLAEMIPHEQLSHRHWSGDDDTILEALIMDGWFDGGGCDPDGTGALAGMRIASWLAAWHATGGLTAADVEAIITDTCDEVYSREMPPGSSEVIARALCHRLTAAGISISGYPAPHWQPGYGEEPAAVTGGQQAPGVLDAVWTWHLPCRQQDEADLAVAALFGIIVATIAIIITGTASHWVTAILLALAAAKLFDVTTGGRPRNRGNR
jgi:hypothetical protein